MKKFTLLFAIVFFLMVGGTNASALDLYAFGFSNFNSGNNLNINGTPYYNTDSGWFDQTGHHTGGNRNYIDGQCDSCGTGPFYHNYFAFDLSPLTGATSATFNVYSYSITQAETYYLYGTSLAPVDVNSSLTYNGRTDIYDALVSGPLMASIYLQPGDSSQFVQLTLNSAGISWLNDHVGEGVVLGGGNELSAPPPVPGVPEPATLLLLGSGIVGIIGLRRKFRK